MELKVLFLDSIEVDENSKLSFYDEDKINDTNSNENCLPINISDFSLLTTAINILEKALRFC